MGGQVIFSRTTNNFHIIDRNLQPAQFINAEGRPVFVSEEDYDPTDEPSTFDRSIDPTLDRLWTNVGLGKARRWNLKFDVNGSPLDNLQLAANYALNLAYDNSSFSCCLEVEAWESAMTAGSRAMPATTAQRPQSPPIASQCPAVPDSANTPTSPALRHCPAGAGHDAGHPTTP